MWFTNYRHSIGRITTSGVVTNYTGPHIEYPIGIAAGPDGPLWFTITNGRNHSIGRITTTGAVTHYSSNDNLGTIGIAAGPDGAMWFTCGSDAIGRITTTVTP
jgi:virginiamycin B lyase